MAETFELCLLRTEGAGRCAEQLGHGTKMVSDYLAPVLLTAILVLAVYGPMVAYGLNAAT